MDVAAFSDENFDPKDWINKALKPAGPVVENKENLASSLVMKLQLMIARLNLALEEQSSSLVGQVPRVTREAEGLRGEAQLLRDKLATLRREVGRLESEEAGDMASLVAMDRVKERVGATQRALKEADNWAHLDTQVEEAFENDDLVQVSSLISSMAASLRLLQHSSDYSVRCAALDQHKNRLEAVLSPQLVAAFTSRNTGQATQLVGMFRAMERDGSLSKYYTKCVRATLLQKWASIVSSEQGEEEPSFKSWLSSFYSCLAGETGEHYSWVQEVFREERPGDLVTALLTEVVTSMEPSQQFCLEAALKLSSSQLELLGDIKQVSDNFLQSVATCLEGASYAKLQELGVAVYKPFRSQVARYEDLESLHLKQELTLWSTGGKDTIDEIHNLSNCIAKISGLISAAGSRCLALTQGAAFPALLNAVAAALSLHLDRYRRIMRRLEKRAGLVDDDWSVLQHCLNANQATGDLLLMLESAEISLQADFMSGVRGYLGSGDAGMSPLSQHHTFLLDTGAREALGKLYREVAGSGRDTVTGSPTPMLQGAYSHVVSLCSSLQHTTYTLMFQPISTQLELIPSLPVWAAETAGSGSLETGEMPEFSFSPCEYITCVGEYLMTLPQHLEPYMVQDLPGLSRAFRESVFPGSSSSSVSAAAEPADFLLGCISATTCTTYLSYIQAIQAKLTTNSGRQLAVDIGYLGDILDDLGHPLTSELSSTAVLLRLTRDKWASEVEGHPQKVINMVAKLKGFGEVN